MKKIFLLSLIFFNFTHASNDREEDEVGLQTGGLISVMGFAIEKLVGKELVNKVVPVVSVVSVVSISTASGLAVIVRARQGNRGLALAVKYGITTLIGTALATYFIGPKGMAVLSSTVIAILLGKRLRLPYDDFWCPG